MTIEDVVIFKIYNIIELRLTGQVKQWLLNAVKPVYNDNLMGHFSAFWSSCRWSRAT